jgi:hypothetical protein
MQNVEVKQVAYHRLDAVDARVAELYYLMTFGADDVVVLAVAIAFFVLREVAAKLVLAH